MDKHELDVLSAVVPIKDESGATSTAIQWDTPTGRIRRRLTLRRLPADPLAELILVWGGFGHGFNAFRHNPVDYARGVRCPALLLFGDQDPYITLAETEEIYGNLPAAKSLHVFHGVGHRLYVKERPDEWRQTVQPFLQSL